ncbi:hypothetical protein [Gemmobacter caeruleus]|uniref:hypothetical protein n=1 Tax=Gemmobacter caeruleus TaxID=2595004 RepID=UPI0011EF6698|nr:hypothetical protein [Gemmobacter caeruleus]
MPKEPQKAAQRREEKFRLAVSFAADHLADQDRSGRLDHLAYDWDTLIELFGKRKIRTLHAIWDSTLPERREAKAQVIAERSYRDPLHFHVARGFVAEMVGKGEVLPICLQEWAAQLIGGTAPPAPTKRPHTPHQHRNRALVLGLLVERLRVELRINPTRSPSSPPHSGCDAVADAWNGLVRGFDRDRKRAFPRQTYETVRNCYFDGKKIAELEIRQLRAFNEWIASRPEVPPRKD